MAENLVKKVLDGDSENITALNAIVDQHGAKFANTEFSKITMVTPLFEDVQVLCSEGEIEFYADENRQVIISKFGISFLGF